MVSRCMPYFLYKNMQKTSLANNRSLDSKKVGSVYTTSLYVQMLRVNWFRRCTLCVPLRVPLLQESFACSRSPKAAFGRRPPPVAARIYTVEFQT